MLRALGRQLRCVWYRLLYLLEPFCGAVPLGSHKGSDVLLVAGAGLGLG